jgi:parallel beta-helix repeat protein
MRIPDPALRLPLARLAASGVTAALLVAAAPAAAVQCGDTLGAGTWVLQSDLVCDSGSGLGVGVTLGNGADLNLNGHSVSMTIGGSGTPIVIAGTGASLHDGTISSGAVGIQLDGGGGHQLSNLVLANLLNIGIRLTGSSGNRITGVQVNGMAVYGIALDHSDRNLIDRASVTDTSGIGPAAGVLVLSSNENAITRSQILRSQCTGVYVKDSSRNVICFNAVQDSSVFLGGPSVDILLRDASTANLVCRNQVSATVGPAVTSDGINIGCKGGCHCNLGGPGISDPSTGATGNLILGNTANGELRYGFAQATGNPGNVFLADQASGNGVANFALDP